ncbi:hypothetical protein RchiOBHm_Chr3g0468131 [Rosa chinensis]|uniref:THO1-MOS11 C-terminal domain-containing protein n=1 Tax=Rosa chinensis TaxID=74649 RepID=A0A2P6RAF4_ROSCH|nr:protein MODIFIER OF SNC1 11 isoform X1 [Rosa chinensis]XP_024187347.1 protein MODIFIER OF SNC1 11 isoform X1 [Rosa chinensis]PRQ43405.1 hypothetical protein RchiOBHm_Chr3g0468131 [Rosa chinensis]
MASIDTQKPTDTTPAVENPTKAVDPPAPAAAPKPDLPVDPPTETPAPTAPPSAVDSAENVSKADSEDPKTAAAAEDGAAPASVVEKKIRRAERFGISVQLTEEEKRNSRAERFGTVSTSHGSEASKKSEELKRKARAERFGIAAPPVASDEDARKKARLARFAPVSKTAKPDPQEEEKRKARSLRFSNGSAGSLSQVNDKGNIEQKAAIAGGAVGKA